MRRLPILLALLGTSAIARAGDKPLTVPAPTWVVPTDLPPVLPAAGEVPVTVLLADQQVRFERGSVTTFGRTVVRIDGAQGLTAGNISLPWRPDIGDLNVHTLVIRRGTEVIDVLGSGQTFTVVRREPNLESATFDGVLTANIQPEGLQVGDILDMAVSVTAKDPVLAGHVEDVVGVGGALPIGRVNLRVSWPDGVPLRWRQAGGLPPLKPTRKDGGQVIALSVDDVAPAQPVKFAPARFQLGRMVELSDFASWADLGALLAPLYAKAATLPAEGPLAAEVARIRAASADTGARTLAALALVQDRVRYVALAMGTGGLVPADAATTWARRYGDCKAKTALLLAILGALDVPAEAVAANAVAGDGIDERLPSVGAFNHVLVRATVGGKPYWLDGTRTGDTALDRLATPAFGWGLPIVPRGAALVRMMPPPLALPTSDTDVAIDATAGLTVPAPTAVTLTLRGDDAVATNAALNALVGDARDRELRAMWRGRYDFIDVDRTSAVFDRAAGTLTFSMTGKARMDWSSGWYETDGLGLGYKADFTRDPGAGRDAPFAVGYPRFTRARETIKLPPGFPATAPVGKLAIDRTVGGVEYRRTGAIKDRVFTAEATERAIAAEFPAAEAPAVQAGLRSMADATVYLRRPDSYTMTKAELDAAMASTPDSAEAFNQRGYALLNQGRQDEAIAQFDAALAREPNNASALANRGMSRVWKNDLDAATRDLAAAEKIEPRHIVIHRARGSIAQRRGDAKGAVVAFDKALAIDPRDGFSLSGRALARRALGDDDAAFADSSAVLALNPQATEMRLLRTNILRGRGKVDEALAEMKAAVAAAPGDPYAQVAAANAHAAMGRRDEAMRFYERAVAIGPSAFVYLNRAMNRSPDDVAGRMADADAALALEPKLADALALKATMLRKQGDLAGAVALYDRALREAPDSAELLVDRAIVRQLGGQKEAAATDFAAARAAAKDGTALNNLCWRKAIAGVALDAAVTDCDAALAIRPKEAAYLDSKGLALLRLGRLADAEAVYSAALAINPALAGSLYGRGIVRLRSGDKTRGEADIAAARDRQPYVAEEFAGYGVTAAAP